MDEDTTVDARELRQLLVTHSAPLLRESLPALEALGRDGNCLDAPVSTELVWVEDVERLLRLRDTEALLEFKEVLLQGTDQVLSVQDIHRPRTFHGANCSNRMMRPF